MHVNIILHPDHGSWIIEKMAQRLVEHASEFGFTATIRSQLDPEANINHWMSYAFAHDRSNTKTTMFVTHVDDPLKLAYLQKALAERVDLGICMSSYAVEELSQRGIPRPSLCYVLPGHDGQVVPRKITIGLTTKLYRDGRKREDLLLRLANEVKLDNFRFEIYGSGWDKVVVKLMNAGAEVAYSPGTDDYIADYQLMRAAIPNFDYYMYLGLDEGSLGTLDALCAGVKTIVTPQGFHVDLPGGITHPVWDYADLKEVFLQISADRDARITAVRSLTWSSHVERHAAIWRALLTNDDTKLTELSTTYGYANSTKIDRMVSDLEFRKRGYSMTRRLSALSRHHRFQKIRKSFRWLSS